MKTIIPEQVKYSCDKCKKEILKDKIDASGYIDFVGRDYSGSAVGGYRRVVELCGACSNDLEKWFKPVEICGQ